MAYQLEVFRFGKWEQRGSYPSVLEAQAHAPRGQYRIVSYEDKTQEPPTLSVMASELISDAIETVKVTVKKRTQRKPSAKTSKPKAAGSKKRGGKTSA